MNRYAKMLTRRSAPRRRGAVMLEFVMILPMFLFLVFFTVDMGRMTMLSGMLSDTAYIAARAGAQHGTREVAGRDVIQEALDRVEGNMPTFGADNPIQLTQANARCSGPQSHVEVEVTKDVDFITPGLSSLLGAFGGGSSVNLNTWTLRSRATVLCEVSR